MVNDLENKILDFIKSNTPIIGPEKGLSLHVENLSFVSPKSDIESQLHAKYAKESIVSNIKGKLILKDEAGNVINESNQISLLKVPVKTDRNSFIINGNEKTVLNQLRLKSGSYTTKDEATGKIKTAIIFNRSNHVKSLPLINIVIDHKDKPSFKISIKRNKEVNFNIVNFMTILGYSDGEIRKALGNNSFADLILETYASKKHIKSVYDLSKALMGFVPDNMTEKECLIFIWDYLMNNSDFEEGKVIKKNLGVSSKILDKNVLFRMIQKTAAVYSDVEVEDKKDDIKFKNVLSSEDLIFDEFISDFEVFKKNTEDILDNNDGILEGKSNIFSVLKLGTKVNEFINTSDLSAHTEETNPLFIEATSRKITQMGDGGLKDSRNQDSARNLTESAMNRIDPVDTPESLNVGLIQYVTNGAVIEDRQIKIKVYKVKKGIIDSKKEILITSDEEDDSVVAFNDSKFIRYNENNDPEFIGETAFCRVGEDKKILPIIDVDYIDSKATNVVGTSPNMVPFVSNNDGMRVLMGAKMQLQAEDLVNKEPPMVSAISDRKTGRTFEEEVGIKNGKPILAKASGIVIQITKSKISVKTDEDEVVDHEYYYHYPLNQSFINNEVVVQIGDIVKAGDMLAEGWQTKGGTLSLGINTRVGYMSFDGYNYEDGMVISEDYAEKMKSRVTSEFEIEIPTDAIGGIGSNCKTDLLKYTTDSSIIKDLNNDCVIYEGKNLSAGNIACAALVPIESENMGVLDSIMSTDSDLKYKVKRYAIPANSYIGGKIVRVMKIDNPSPSVKQKIVLTMVKEKALKEGDKLAGRHGNKGTITKVVPTELMPTTEDGKPLELLYSPLAVPSRKNVGQILEVNAGLIAEKKGEKYKMCNFDHNEKDRVLEGLKDIGIKNGKVKVFMKRMNDDGKIKSVPLESNVTVGNMYIMKLKHKVDDKIQSRSNLETPVTRREYMPSKITGVASGERRNPQSLGEMETRALQGHGAVWNLLECTTLKADGGGGDAAERAAIFKALASSGKELEGEDLLAGRDASPETVRVLSDTLKAMGLTVKPTFCGKPVKSLDKPFDSIGIAPMKTEEFLKSVGTDKEVTKHSDFFDARKLYATDKTKEDASIKGGLADPEIFGSDEDKESRSKWGYVKLAIPMPNPVLLETNYNPYSALTGINTEKLKKIMTGESVVIGDDNDFAKTLSSNLPEKIKKEYLEEYHSTLEILNLKPGDIISVNDYDSKISKKDIFVPFKTGSEFLADKLSSIDLKTAIKEARADLNSKTTVKDMQKGFKTVKILENLKENKMKPIDLMMTHLPVAPLYLRPIMVDKDNRRTMSSDVNKLYSSVIQSNSYIASKLPLAEDGSMLPLSSTGDARSAANATSNIYKAISNLTGKTSGIDHRTKKPLIGFAEELGGKTGLVRGKMLSKRNDFSGRSVIGVDPNLGLNEVAIPLDIAKNVYKPFIQKELVKSGYASNQLEAKDKIKSNDPAVRKVLDKIVKDRPVIINRQPTLHKLGIQSFTPVIRDKVEDRDVRNISLNPLVVTAFNADFDGDTMAAHVPITEKAKEEAKALLSPVNNLINPTDGKMIVEIRHEMLLGIYKMSYTIKNPTGTNMQYRNKKDILDDYLDGKIKSSQRVSVPICPHETTAGMALINYSIPEKLKVFRDFKNIWEKKKIANMFAEIYRLAEKDNFSKISRMDIAHTLDAFKNIGFKTSTRAGVSIGIDDFTAIKDLNKTLEKANKKGGSITDWQEAQKEIESKIKNGALPDDNSLQIMMASGARTNPLQVRNMISTFGVGRDVVNEMKTPIKSSLAEGLSTHEFFTMGYDSRKGAYDRSVATAKPGEISRNIWSNTQGIVINEEDCKTRDYITISKKSKSSIVGRVAAKQIIGSNNTTICRRGDLISNQKYDLIYADNTIENVEVRSVLRCKTVKGKCAKCYGSEPGSSRLVKVGTPIGVLASQAVGEPVTQMTMNTFHMGGASGSIGQGLGKVTQILNMSAPKSHEATIAGNSGYVKSITEQVDRVDIVIDAKTYKIKKDINGKCMPIRVKVGDFVKAGDFITSGDNNDILVFMDNKKTDIVLTSADPKKLVKEKIKSSGVDVAVDETRDYLTNSLESAFKASNANFDRKHMETVISSITNIMVVTDPGDSNYLKGQEVDINELKRWNENALVPYSAKTVKSSKSSEILGRTAAEDIYMGNTLLVRKGEVINQDNILNVSNLKRDIKILPKQIEYTPDMKGVKSNWQRGHGNWVSNMAGESVNNQIARGVAFGQTDTLADPRSQMMTGKILSIGKGFDIDDKKRNSYSNNMMNFFETED